jgi:hypothetical protein
MNRKYILELCCRMYLAVLTSAGAYFIASVSPHPTIPTCMLLTGAVIAMVYVDGNDNNNNGA